jgi:hypothetical protein
MCPDKCFDVVFYIFFSFRDAKTLTSGRWGGGQGICTITTESRGKLL